MARNFRANDEGIARVAELIGGRRVALLATIALDGGLAARPMALPERPFDGTLLFVTRADSSKVREIVADARVNVSILDGTYLCLTGRASVDNDPALKAEAWDDTMTKWFGCGPDDESVTAILVRILAAEYWESPGYPPEVIPLVEGPAGEGSAQQ